MGMPLRDQATADPPPPPPPRQHQPIHDHLSSAPSPSPHHLFVYGDSRPDITPPTPPPNGASRAWLLGSRLYACNVDGRQHAALRLEESGHAVLGYTLPLGTSSDRIHGLLDSFERTEYSPNLYERDIVEVVTESGQRVRSYVYHRPDADRSNPVQGGDWLQHQHR